MNEMKCTECGTELTLDMKECPNCGCTINRKAEDVSMTADAHADETTAVAVKAKKLKINIMAVIALVLGVVMVFMGMNLKDKQANLDVFRAMHFDVNGARFGADFYTEIYGASDTIVDALSAINSGIGSVSRSLAEMANLIYYPMGMTIVAMGMGVIAVSLIHLFRKEELK